MLGEGTSTAQPRRLAFAHLLIIHFDGGADKDDEGVKSGGNARNARNPHNLYSKLFYLTCCVMRLLSSGDNWLLSAACTKSCKCMHTREVHPL